MVGLLGSTGDVVLAVTVFLCWRLGIWVWRIVVLGANPGLCRVRVSFLGFCCPLWFFGECGDCVLSVRQFI